jgi:hypothetical protein
MREAQSDSARLAIADQAREKGELNIASRMYLKLASNRVPTPARAEAQKRLDTIREDTRKQLDDLIQRLADVDNVSPSEQMPPESADRVKTCISELEELAEQVGRVPEVGREVKSALAQNKAKPHVRAVLDEPDAKQLWDEGQALEGKGQVCCAFLLYEEAARLSPAPSALVAERRLAELKADPAQVEAAEACRVMQWCHQQYRLAERVARVTPERARDMYAKIVERSPDGSPVRAAAQSELVRLDQAAVD